MIVGLVEISVDGEEAATETVSKTDVDGAEPAVIPCLMPDDGQHEGGFSPSRQAHGDKACEEEEQKVGMGEEEGCGGQSGVQECS